MTHSGKRPPKYEKVRKQYYDSFRHEWTKADSRKLKELIGGEDYDADSEVVEKIRKETRKQVKRYGNRED